MPSNLNALIRYKQIDKCLRNKYVDCTIDKMIEMCSVQLGEYRGVYKQVSERTIRDDIKTMRGDSLGFNAEIIVSKGVYSYKNESFSIFNSSIDDLDLLKNVMLILLEERGNISNPKLDLILSTLSIKTGITLPTNEVVECNKLENNKVTKKISRLISNKIKADDNLDEIANELSEINLSIEPSRSYLVKPDPSMFDSSKLYSWKNILELF